MSEGRGNTNFTLWRADRKLKSLEMETANLFYSYGILILLINFKIKHLDNCSCTCNYKNQQGCCVPFIYFPISNILQNLMEEGWEDRSKGDQKERTLKSFENSIWKSMSNIVDAS